MRDHMRNRRVKPLVVLVNGKHPFSSGGGYQTYTYHLAQLFHDLGYPVEVVCFGPSEGTRKAPFGRIVTCKSRLYELPILRTMELAGLALLAPILAKRVLSGVERNQPFVLWGIGPWSFTAAIVKLFRPRAVFLSYYPTTFLHEFRGTIAATTVADHGLFIKLKLLCAAWMLIPAYTLIEWFFLSVSDRIVNHYASAERILAEQFGLSQEKFIRIPYYIAPVGRSYRSTAPLPRLSHPLVVLICRHDGRKGINILLHAFAILNERGCDYTGLIVGEGMLYRQHQRLAQRLGLTKVHIVGFYPDAASILKLGDIYVFPSVEEGSSAISILEAMQAGLPIVSTNIDGIPEDLEHEKTALLVPPGSPLVLADAMEQLLREQRFAQALGRRAQKAFHHRFNRAKVKRVLAHMMVSLHRSYDL